jgi:hypothetical protein
MHWRTAILCGSFLALAQAAPATARRGAHLGRPVTTTVTWTDRDGVTGEVPFQGTLRGRKVRGILQPASGELWVEATVDDDGTVSGTIKTAAGDAVGIFDGRLDDTGKLRGSYTVPGGDGGALSAPANALSGRGGGRTTAPTSGKD